MDAGGWTVNIEDDNSWLCEHRDLDNNPAPARRLLADDLTIENPLAEPDRCMGHMTCPDCGTYWRVWERLRIAKQYIAPPSVRSVSAQSRSAAYRRLRTRDVDHVLAAVLRSIPNVEITQYTQYRPFDDEGLWFFRVPGAKKDIQIESSSGECPFFIEHSDMKSSTEAINANSIDDTVKVVVAYLENLHEQPDSL